MTLNTDSTLDRAKRTESALAGPARSARLRRLDWRFLLPSAQAGPFRQILLSGGPEGLAHQIVAAKLAAEVTHESAPATRADAAVLLHDGTLSLEQAAQRLDQGGVLYMEIARTSPAALWMTPETLRRRLKRAGLTLTGIYWAAPNFEECRRYIPLDIPGAVDWYFASLFVAGTPAHQALRILARLATAIDHRWLGWVAPHLCVTAVGGVSPTAAPSVLGAPTAASVLPKDGLRPMLLTSGQDDASRVIMLPFAAQPSRSPAAVIKIATDPAFNGETEHEQCVLEEVRSCVDAELRQGIPAPQGRFHYGALAVGMESCAPGRSLWASSGAWGASPRTKMADMEIGVRWLAEFHRQTEVARLPWDSSAIEQWVDAPLAAYRQVRPVTEAEQRLFASMRAHAERLIGAHLPLAWQHNDFAPWNLFRSGERLSVIDWEFNRQWERTRAGPVLCDLLYFVTYWNNVANHLYSTEAEHSGLYELFIQAAPRNRCVRAARRATTHYMTALHVDRRFLPLLLVYTWAERVVYSHARARKLAPHAPTPRAADKFAGYVGQLALHADALFAADSGGNWPAGAVQTVRVAADVSDVGAVDGI